MRALPLQEVCAALPAMLLLCVMLGWYRDFVSDDAYISFRYAEHLATGRGLEWNPGYRVEGYSNFLWVVLLASLRVLGMAVPDAARALVWASGLSTVLLVVLLARHGRARPSYGLLVLAPLPMVLSFPYQYWTAMRLETCFFGMLLLLSLWLFVREEERVVGPRWPSAVAFLALAITRPEGPAFLAVPAIYLLCRLRSRRDLRRLLRERTAWLLLLAVGLALYHIWRISYFGELLPNTYHAKVGGDDVLERGYLYVRRFVDERPYHLVLLVAALLLRASASRAGALMLGTLLTLVVVVVLEGGDWMREWRLLMPAMPLLVATLAVGLQGFAAALRPRERGALGAGMLLLAAGLQGSMGTPKLEWEQALKGEKAPLAINLEGAMTRTSREVGLWLRRHARPGDLVAVNHAGALPFYSGLPTIDMVGLNDLHIARRTGTRHAKWDPDYVLRRKPRFIVLNTNVEPLDGTYTPGYWVGETVLFEHPQFQHHYMAERKYWRWQHMDVAFRGAVRPSESFIMVFRRSEGRFSRVGRCLDFESGDYRGWTLQGKAFGARPAKGGIGYQRAERFQGRFLANSYPANDQPAGLLRSDPLLLAGERMELLVGGGGEPAKAGVRLVVGGKVVRTASGLSDGVLRREVWDIGEFVGKQAIVEIYDNGPGPWGHVLADDICQYRLNEEKTR